MIKENLSIVVGAKGLIGTTLCKKLKERGDYLISLDINNINSNFISKLKKKNLQNINIFFTQIYNDKNSNEKKSNNAKLSLLQYRNKIISSWVNSDSSQFLKAINNQICLPDQFLKRIIFYLNNNNYRKNIIFFGSVYEKTRMLEYFYKNKFFFFKHPAYSISKRALVSYQNFLCDMFFDKNIFINTISPGVVERNQKNWFVRHLRKLTPITHSLVSVEEIANIAIYLTNNNLQSSAIHNQVIYADRGTTVNL
jgi:hypothetical protein